MSWACLTPLLHVGLVCLSLLLACVSGDDYSLRLLFLAPFVFALSRNLLVSFQMCCCCFFLSVLSALLVFLFPRLLLLLLVAPLCLSPLILPRVRCPRLLFASFCGPSSLVLPTPSLLTLPLVGLFLLPLLTCLLLFMQYSWACCFLGLFS